MKKKIARKIVAALGNMRYIWRGGGGSFLPYKGL